MAEHIFFSCVCSVSFLFTQMYVFLQARLGSTVALTASGCTTVRPQPYRACVEPQAGVRPMRRRPPCTCKRKQLAQFEDLCLFISCFCCRSLIRVCVAFVYVTTLLNAWFWLEYIIKIKIHSSCEIEDFVETHICKLCVMSCSDRAYYWVCVLIKDIGRRLPLTTM